MSRAAAQDEKNVEKRGYLAGWVPYRIKRYWFYVVVTIISVVTPWITINGNHIFLLDFDQARLHLLGVAFDMQELYLMPFILILLFLGIFAITAVGGRAWCGWACPQTIFRVVYRDFIETKLLGLRKRVSNKQEEPDMRLPSNQAKKLVAILIWSALSLLAAADLMWYFVPPENFFKYLADPSEHMILVGCIISIALFLVADIVFMKEDFCIYICPYSRVQSVLYDKDTIMAIYDTHRGGDIYEGQSLQRHKLYVKQTALLAADPDAECTVCESCVTVCPTHIDIRKGLQLECINCLECVDACTKVMGALGKPSLVKWSSEKETADRAGKTQILRTKTILYFVALVLIFGMLLFMGSKKENMLLNVNKTTRLYKVLDGGVVENDYIFLVKNTDNKPHMYYFEVENRDIKIVRPLEPFKIDTKGERKIVVVLKTDKILVNNPTKDTPLPIKIKAYAVDDKAKIVVERDSVFTYPRIDLVGKGKE